jgi:ABC-type sugar transport system permease subunit
LNAHSAHEADFRDLFFKEFCFSARSAESAFKIRFFKPLLGDKQFSDPPIIGFYIFSPYNLKRTSTFRNSGKFSSIFMIGIIILIFLAYRIYHAAKETGRNAVGWTLAAIGVYVVIQLLIGFGFVFLVEIGHQIFGWREDALNNYVIPISFLSVILSLVGVWILANYVSSEPENKNALQPPPQF